MLAGLGSGAVILAAGPGRAATDPLVAKIMLEDERLWLAASVNGSDPLLFVIDTGAGGNFIRPEQVDRLKLQRLGGSRVVGLGKNQADTGIVRAKTVVLGGAARQDDMMFDTYDFGRGIPADAAGLFAAGLVTAHDCELDFDTGTWRVWPGGGAVRDGFVAVPSAITRPDRTGGSEKIYVTAQIDGRPYRLLLDTGAPRGVLLFPVGAARSRMFEGRPFAPVHISGFGGRSARLARMVRAERLELGPLQLERPLVTVMDPGEATHGWNADGIMGLPNIMLLNLLTDVRASRLWVRRNHQPVPPERYGGSGLWIDRDARGAVTVSSVGTGSPAAAAGIAVGDRIVDPPGFADALRRINGPRGSAIMLGIDRGGTRMEKRLTPADYL
jgi:serine protease Do